MSSGVYDRREAIVAISGAAIAAGCAGPRLAVQQSAPAITRAQFLQQIDQMLSASVSQGFAGVVLLKQNGETLLDKPYGFADADARRAMTLDTGFDIGSLVKPFTASAILRLETDGALQTSDSASRFLPGLTGDKAAITIDHLLRHTAGLPDFVDVDGRPTRYTLTSDPDYELVTKSEILRRAALCSLEHPPGSAEKYSNLGYSLLAAIVEAAANKPYEEFVQRTLFAPAGMTRTGYVAPQWRNEQLAVGVAGGRRWGTPLDHPWLPDGPSWNLRGNGGMLSTSGELAKWLDGLQRGAVLAASARDKLYDIYVHRNRRGTRTMGAAGSNDVFNACYLWYLDEDRLVLAMTSDNRVMAERLVPDLAARVRDLPTA